MSAVAWRRGRRRPSSRRPGSAPKSDFDGPRGRGRAPRTPGAPWLGRGRAVTICRRRCCSLTPVLGARAVRWARMYSAYRRRWGLFQKVVSTTSMSRSTSACSNRSTAVLRGGPVPRLDLDPAPRRPALGDARCLLREVAFVAALDPVHASRLALASRRAAWMRSSPPAMRSTSRRLRFRSGRRLDPGLRARARRTGSGPARPPRARPGDACPTKPCQWTDRRA